MATIEELVSREYDSLRSHIFSSTIKCNVRVENIYFSRKEDDDNFSLKNPLKLDQKTYTFTYDYPLTNKATFRHNLDSDTSPFDILKIAAADYHLIYDKENANSEIGPSPTTFNRGSSNGPYGIYGHYITDLYFEGISIDKNNCLITFAVGS